MASVTLRNICKSYDDTQVTRNVNLDIDDGEFVVFVGPSGCGKSTLLRMIAGLEDITSGDLYIGNDKVNNLPPKEREVGMVFQSYALYPHMNVAENMAFGLKLAKTDKAEIDRRVNDAAKLLQLNNLLERKPKDLSGGQRQRVAIGRTIVREPTVFLFDEPLSNLDASLRVQMRIEISRLHKRLDATMVYVTHDQVEAMTMGDRVAVLKDGLLQQVDTPRKLYDRPQNVFVAGFIGSPAMNLVQLPIIDGGVQFGDAVLPIAREILAKATGNRVTVGVRPEKLTVAPKGLIVDVDVIEELGSDGYLYGRVQLDGTEQNIVVRVHPIDHPMAGDKIHLQADPEAVHVFDTESGERLN